MAATLPDFETLILAGIDPKTGLPLKQVKLKCLGDEIKKVLRIRDEQDAVNRYEWKGLPDGLDGNLVERILYYKGQGMFFKLQDTYLFLPFALDGTIDVYGRFMGVTPLPFGSGSTQGKPNAVKPWIQGLKRLPVYNKDMEINNPDEMCVLLRDYTQQISQNILPRQILQEPILDAMSEAFPLARTSLIAHSGIKGMRVQEEGQAQNVRLASQSITRAALSGDPWIPIVGSLEFQDLTDGGTIRSEEYLLYLQALDNFRLSLYGLKNNGVFEKKEHVLNAEQEMNDNSSDRIYEDGLKLRKDFCDKINKLWALGITCEASESEEEEEEGAAENQFEEESTDE